MESEEFYRKIQEKIERAEFAPDFPEWNQESVWERIEQRKPQTKTVFLWQRYAVAASVALVCLFGILFLNKNNQKEIGFSKAQSSKVAEAQSFRGNEATSNQVLGNDKTLNQKLSTPQLQFIKKNPVQKPILIEQLSVDLANQENINAIETQPIPQEETHKHPMPATTLIAADSPHEQFLDVKPLKMELADNQPFVEAPRVEKTVVLEIPDSEEYFRPQKIEKKNFVARLFKQVGKFNTEGTVDWNELNVKPNKIWAYMKESMKNEKRETK